MRPLRSFTLLCAALLAGTGLPRHADAADAVQLTIRDHLFSPDSIRVPSGTRLRIEVTNADATPAEFESSDLKAEKIIVPGGKVTVLVGPLKPGTYAFFDDYHPELAKGTLVAE